MPCKRFQSYNFNYAIHSCNLNHTTQDFNYTTCNFYTSINYFNRSLRILVQCNLAPRRPLFSNAIAVVDGRMLQKYTDRSMLDFDVAICWIWSASLHMVS